MLFSNFIYFFLNKNLVIAFNLFDFLSVIPQFNIFKQNNFYEIVNLVCSLCKMSSDQQQNDDLEAILNTMSNKFDVEEIDPSVHPHYLQFKNYGLEKQKQQQRRSDYLKRQQEYVI